MTYTKLSPYLFLPLYVWGVSFVKNIEQKEKIIWLLQHRIALTVVGFKNTCVALYSTFKGWVFQAKLLVQCTSNNSLHVKYAFGNSCNSKMGHHWFRCGLSPFPLQAIIYRLTLMYSQLGPWEQTSVKFQTKRIFIHENLKRLTSKWWPFCLCLNMLIKSYYYLIIAHNIMI